MTEQERIMELLNPLFSGYDEELPPASERSLAELYRQLPKRDVPDDVFEQLAGFYQSIGRDSMS